MGVGRDLVRALQAVEKFPGFDSLWKDIYEQPASLSPNFAGTLQLLAKPTPRHFHAVRVCQDLESKTIYIMDNIPQGRHLRNFEWLYQQYFGTAEGEMLIPDLVRFVIGVYHPTNEKLASNVVPRFAFLGQLMRYIKSKSVLRDVHMAVFFDWLWFNPQYDNIMSIEPAILLIERSVEKYPAFSGILIEFLNVSCEQLFPVYSNRIHDNIEAGMAQIIQKRVIRTLFWTYDNLNSEGPKKCMKSLFGTFLQSSSRPTAEPVSNAHVTVINPVKQSVLEATYNQLKAAAPEEVAKSGVLKHGLDGPAREPIFEKRQRVSVDVVMEDAEEKRKLDQSLGLIRSLAKDTRWTDALSSFSNLLATYMSSIRIQPGLANGLAELTQLGAQCLVASLQLTSTGTAREASAGDLKTSHECFLDLLMDIIWFIADCETGLVPDHHPLADPKLAKLLDELMLRVSSKENSDASRRIFSDMLKRLLDLLPNSAKEFASTTYKNTSESIRALGYCILSRIRYVMRL